ncbi:MAG: hypothetical protein ACI392_01910 [Paludibacteraceae bacterium]
MKHLKTFAALCCVAAMFAACEKNDVEPIVGDANGHDYIDLGLSVKWATCNIGATTPEGYGHYYAWGETQPKDNYYWNTYNWCDGTQTTLTKYCSDDSYGKLGFTDKKIVLDLADDAANANWGGAWRMPTDAEWRELIDNCTWTWTTLNGINGYEVKGTNGNSIFLPAAGFYGYETLVNSCSGCYYWSSSLNTEYPSRAWLGFDNTYFCRYYGLSVRAVMK